MTIKQTLKNMVMYAAMAASVLGLTPNFAKAGNSAELMSGQKSTTLDLKVNARLGPLNFFTRHRPSVDYENQMNYFGSNVLGYALVDGLDAVAEVQVMTDAGAVPKLGMEYFRQIGDLSIFGWGTVSVEKSPVGELMANIGYRPRLTQNLSLAANLEAATNFGREHNFSIQRARLGLGIGNYEIGALQLT